MDFCPIRHPDHCALTTGSHAIGALRRLRLVQPRQGQADCGGAAVGDAEARQALVPAPGAARLPRRHQPVGDAQPVAHDRAGARAIALSDPARLARGRRLAVGQQGGRLLARAQERRHAADRGHRRRRLPGTTRSATSPGASACRCRRCSPAASRASRNGWTCAAYRDGADKRDAKFIELAADFAAAIHGMPKEDLLSQEVRQQRRALDLGVVGGGVAAGPGRRRRLAMEDGGRRRAARPAQRNRAVAAEQCHPAKGRADATRPRRAQLRHRQERGRPRRVPHRPGTCATCRACGWNRCGGFSTPRRR